MKKHLEKAIPARFLDTGLDAFRLMGDMQIHCVITLDGEIDEKRLENAARLMFKAEPVLGRRFAPGYFRDSWEPFDTADSCRLCELVHSQDVATDTIRFLTSEYPDGASVKIRILRRQNEDGGQTDRICVKADHRLADAGGVKEYVYKLAFMYNKLGDDPCFQPEINLHGRRSIRQILDRFSFPELLAILLAGLKAARRWIAPGPVWRYETSGKHPHYVIRKVSGDEFLGLKTLSQRIGVTLNDVVVAALFRTLYECIRPEPGTHFRLVTTADNRRYLPLRKGEALCNLSGYAYLNIGSRLGKTLEHTARIVHGKMNWFKHNYIGLHDYIAPPLALKLLPAEWTRRIVRNGFAFLLKHHIQSAITNMGAISPDKLVFDGIPPADAFLTPSVLYPPVFCIGVSGYKDSLTFSLGYLRDDQDDNDKAARLMEKLHRNLTDFHRHV